MSKPIWAGLRWRMILLMMLGGVLNYLSRSTLSVAAPTLMHELHVSTAQYSWVTGIFSFTLMFQPLCGYVLDVRSGRWSAWPMALSPTGRCWRDCAGCWDWRRAAPIPPG
jgi:sugar phosphate permease